MDTTRCVGAGQCVTTAPDLFDQGDDGIVVLLSADPGDGASVREAAQVCPSGALSFEE